MKKQEFLELIGEDPEDILGGDWRNTIEDYEKSSGREMCWDCNRIMTAKELEDHRIKNFQNAE